MSQSANKTTLPIINLFYFISKILYRDRQNIYFFVLCVLCIVCKGRVKIGLAGLRASHVIFWLSANESGEMKVGDFIEPYLGTPTSEI